MAASEGRFGYNGPVHTYVFRTIARSRSDTATGVGVVVTVSVLAGSDGNVSFCGTVTMTESEWDTLADALSRTLGGAVTFEDQAPPLVEP